MIQVNGSQIGLYIEITWTDLKATDACAAPPDILFN